MNEEIKITREWLERLVELGENLYNVQATKSDLNYLLGYIDSAKEILKKHE